MQTPRTAAPLMALLCLLLLVGPAFSDEGDAGAREAVPRIDARNLELLPLNDLERGELARDHPEFARRLAVLVKRAEKLRALRAGRTDPDDDGGRRIAAQVRGVEKELEPLLAQVLAATKDDAINARLLRHMASAPRGPQRVARYAMGLALYVEDMPAATRKLLSTVLPRVEGALLALQAQKRGLRLATKQAGLEGAKQQAVLASFDQRVRVIERRWWRLVDYTVPVAQRAALHRVLPRAYQKRESILQHVYGLPGLKPSQGVRVRAMLEEVQAQASPDSAAVQRHTRTARDPQASGEARAAAGRGIAAAQGRLIELQRWAVEESKRILSKPQWEALEAIPPRVSFQDRKATSVQVLAGTALEAKQKVQLTAMRRELAAYRSDYQARRIKTAARGAGMSPDSPQMAGMQMKMANIQAEGNAVQRRFNGRVLLELMTPEQVIAWVVAPRGDR